LALHAFEEGTRVIGHGILFCKLSPILLFGNTKKGFTRYFRQFDYSAQFENFSYIAHGLLKELKPDLG